MKLQTEIENPLISSRHPIKDTQQEPLEIYGFCRICGKTLHYEDEPLDLGPYVICDMDVSLSSIG